MTNDKFSFYLSSYSFVDLVGEESEKFLNGQLTISAETPKTNTACLAAFCNPKGRIVSLFHIVKIDRGYRLFMPSDLVNPTITYLKKYALFFKVELIPASEKPCIIGFVNRGNDYSDIDAQLIDIANTQLSIATLTEENPHSHLANVTTEETDYEWYYHLAQNKIPWINQQSMETFLPHDLNLPELKAIDFNKGCYTGQEVIARMQYKGKLKQHLQLLEGSVQTCKEDNLGLFQNDKKVGTVICYSPTKQKSGLLLAIVKDKANFDDFFRLDDKNTSILKIVK